VRLFCRGRIQALHLFVFRLSFGRRRRGARATRVCVCCPPHETMARSSTSLPSWRRAGACVLVPGVETVLLPSPQGDVKKKEKPTDAPGTHLYLRRYMALIYTLCIYIQVQHMSPFGYPGRVEIRRSPSGGLSSSFSHRPRRRRRKTMLNFAW
jgi:hypothetical protein